MANNGVFTSGEVAKICSVSSPTVIKWIDSGTLKGFKIPGSKARRVARRDLLAFMSKHAMPLDRIDGLKTRVLVVDDDNNFCKMMKREFDLDGSFDALIVENAFRAGAMLEEFKPEFILLDILLGGIDGREVCKFLRDNTKLKNTRVIGMSGAYLEDTIMGLDGSGFDDFLKKPFKFDELREKIYSLQNKVTSESSTSTKIQTTGTDCNGTTEMPHPVRRKLKSGKEAMNIGGD